MSPIRGDLASRYLLGCDTHPAISVESTQQHWSRLLEACGLPNRNRTDNRMPFASNSLARLSKLSVWIIKLGIHPELIEPGQPQHNGVRERMHRTLRQEATVPPSSSLRTQQHRSDRFVEEYNEERPLEALGMKRSVQVSQVSGRSMPRRIESCEFPARCLVRRGGHGGIFRVFKNQVFVSNTLQEDFVGLEEVDDGMYDLFFCFCQIGRYELRSNKIHDLVSKVPVSYQQVDLASRV